MVMNNCYHMEDKQLLSHGDGQLLSHGGWTIAITWGWTIAIPSSVYQEPCRHVPGMTPLPLKQEVTGQTCITLCIHLYIHVHTYICILFFQLRKGLVCKS